MLTEAAWFTLNVLANAGRERGLLSPEEILASATRMSGKQHLVKPSVLTGEVLTKLLKDGMIEAVGSGDLKTSRYCITEKGVRLVMEEMKEMQKRAESVGIAVGQPTPRPATASSLMRVIQTDVHQAALYFEFKSHLEFLARSGHWKDWGDGSTVGAEEFMLKNPVDPAVQRLYEENGSHEAFRIYQQQRGYPPVPGKKYSRDKSNPLPAWDQAAEDWWAEKLGITEKRKQLQ